MRCLGFEVPSLGDCRCRCRSGNECCAGERFVARGINRLHVLSSVPALEPRGFDLGKCCRVASLFMPLQHRELLHRFRGVDVHSRVPPGRGVDLAVGAHAEPLLAGVLGVRELERRRGGVDGRSGGDEGVLGDEGVGGGGEVVGE